MVSVITSTIAAIGSVLASFLAAKAKAEQERSAQDAKAYREQRERLDKAKWKVLVATMEGVTVLLHNAKGEKMNGNVDAALAKITTAKAILEDTHMDILAKVS